ncbi:MAG: SxtJ family membrane protein [Acidobacteria bacterium]|nr:SxtJ family membrane protein [Acidobacteriota bacterium]
MWSQQKTSKTSFRAEREFGLLVGLMAILIGSWWLYRGYWEAVATGLVGVGSALAILGLLFPRALVLPNRWWMALAMWLSLITTPIILGIIFFLIVMPIGMIKRLFGWDPLRRRAPSAVSYWVPYNARQQDPHHFEKMY